MIVIQEITKNADYPNHVYVVTDDKSKLVAYIKAGTKDVIKFNKPMRFSTSYRKFRVIS